MDELEPVGHTALCVGVAAGLIGRCRQSRITRFGTRSELTIVRGLLSQGAGIGQHRGCGPDTAELPVAVEHST